MVKSIRSFGIISTVFALILSLSTALWGGTTGKIAGRVTDAATGEPLAGANVMIVGTTLGAAADAEGDYFIINVTPGTYEVQSTMIGYQALTLTGVIVRLDLTTPLDFNLASTVVVGEAVTVTAEREIIKMDQSASAIHASVEEIVDIPLVNNLEDYIHLQAGIEGDAIRGGGLDQTAFMLDGMMVVDNRENRPMVMVNLSAVQELSVIKGGFNAEYGNIRSGLINVTTREGSPTEYHGSIDLRLSPAHLKHSGVSILNKESYFLRSYLDEDVMWDGTSRDSEDNLKGGYWDEATQDQYPKFNGWDEYSQALKDDDDPLNDRTPAECRDLFMYRHAVEGSGDLDPEQTELEYAHKPDWNGEVSLDGPIPLIGKYLGNASFLASYRENWEMYALPTNEDYFKEKSGQIKLTFRLAANMKLKVEGLWGEVKGLETSRRSATRILRKGLGIPDNNAYLPWTDPPADIISNVYGLSFDHVLSPRTFYNVNISHVRVKNIDNGFVYYRDTTKVGKFGNTPVDETPYGAWYLPCPEGWGMYHPAHIKEINLNNSVINTVTAKFDLTSQINKYNQIKFGVLFNYDDINWDREQVSHGQEHHNYHNVWDHAPIRGGAYLQNKLEFEGMIANFGLRLDYNEPNCDWFTVDRYSIYFRKEYKDVFTEVTPKEPAKGHLKISPRLGISHPISDNAKLYFNYGHFYSMPPTEDMYRIDYGQPGRLGGIEYIGNPSADLPKTVAYELGVEFNLSDMFLIHLSGYYKDVSDQTGDVDYIDFDQLTNYSTAENNHYEDIRGFELTIDKRYGRWLSGFFNYNYRVETSGYLGREENYEDLREQRIYGLQNPYQEVPLARPIARGVGTVRSPVDWGPTIAGIKPLGDIGLSLLFTYKSGDYETWDPLTTLELKDNLHWKGNYDLDARISKKIRIGNSRIELFADINNVLDMKMFYTRGDETGGTGFVDDDDKTSYLESLHLPMYEGQEYKDAGYTPGDDVPGDVKSDDKPYINMPNRGFLTYQNPRSIYLGLKVNF